MEAHDGMSAKIVEQTGFKGIWASGLAISSSLGVRDNNELSFKEVADHLYYICSRVDIPVLLDMDTGYGTWEIALTALHQMERAGVAGVVIEDKKFPKVNSFLSNSAGDLEDIDTYCNKIRALQDNKFNEDLVILTRIESFISGLGLDDAIARAKAYIDAGSDGIVIHSKKSDSSEIDSFVEAVKLFNKNIPIIIIPTKYYKVPMKHFQDMGVSLAIWANHNIRASLKAMRETTDSIYRNQNLLEVEPNVATVREIFDLQGNRELDKLSKEYESSKVSPDKLIILGSTRGSESLHKYTKDRPKCLIEVEGKPIVSHIIDSFRSVGIDNISLVANYKKEFVQEYYKNDDTLTVICNYNELDKSSDVSSIPRDIKIEDDSSIIIAYGDLIIDNFLARRVKECNSDITIVVSDTVESSAHDTDSLRCYLEPEFKPLIMHHMRGIKLGRTSMKVSQISNTEKYSKEFGGIIKVRSQELLDKLLDSDSIASFLVECHKVGRAIHVIPASDDELVDINTAGDIVDYWLV